MLFSTQKSTKKRNVLNRQNDKERNLSGNRIFQELVLMDEKKAFNRYLKTKNQYTVCFCVIVRQGSVNWYFQNKRKIMSSDLLYFFAFYNE